MSEAPIKVRVQYDGFDTTQTLDEETAQLLGAIMVSLPSCTSFFRHRVLRFALRELLPR